MQLRVSQAIWSTTDQLVRAEGVGSLLPGRKLWARRNQRPFSFQDALPLGPNNLRCHPCPGPLPFLQKLPRSGSSLQQWPVQYLLVYQFPTPLSQRNKPWLINLDEWGSLQELERKSIRTLERRDSRSWGNALGWVPGRRSCNPRERPGV